VLFRSWLDPGSQSHLKYHDYAASIGRAMIAPLGFDDVVDHVKGLKDDNGLIHSDGIDRARQALMKTFPADLCAKADASGETVDAI